MRLRCRPVRDTAAAPWWWWGLSIDRGETLAIFGDSGSGKSTIGQILAGIYLPPPERLDGQRLSYPLPAERIQPVSASGGDVQSQAAADRQ
ncbi:MAG: ABC transporter ATP-binding protein [Flavonifractor plautii]